MPVLKIKTKPYSDDYALENVVHYVLRPGCSCGGYAVDPNYAVEQMLMVKEKISMLETSSTSKQV